VFQETFDALRGLAGADDRRCRGVCAGWWLRIGPVL
jgi:hypothetical protein